MRKTFLISLLVSLSTAPLLAQVSSHIDLLGRYQRNDLPRLNGYQIWNDVTGYFDSIKHREYAIAGSTDSIYFIDVTDAANPVLCDVKDGSSHGVVNRDYECYSHYAYCVSDNGPRGAFQIFDLQYLPDSVHLVLQTDTPSYHTHSIFIEAASKRLYMCINRLKAGGVAAMDIMSLEDPEKPVFAGRLQVPVFGDGAPAFRNVHEVYVRHDTAYCSVEYQGLWIFDLKNLTQQRLLSVIRSYPENGYNHTSTLDAEGKYLLFTDEIPAGLGIKLYDIHDIFNPTLVSIFRSNMGATAHNPYWIGSYGYFSYYHDGFYIFNLKNKQNPFVSAYYHTSPWPPANYEGYKGCWGIYPYLPSGNILASDMGEGIFILKTDTQTFTGLNSAIDRVRVEVGPNPFANTLQFNTERDADYVLDIYDIKGELVLHKTYRGATFEAETQNFERGMYFAVVQSGSNQWIQKLIKE